MVHCNVLFKRSNYSPFILEFNRVSANVVTKGLL